MEPHFSRISCWVYNHPVPPIPEDAIVYYESSWDFQTNKYVKDNLRKINDALSTYPSGYCRFQLYYVNQPQLRQYSSEEEAQTELQHNATMYHNATSPFEGIISCALMQDKNHADSTTQRVMTINIEDCTEQAILAAIRYMVKLADKLKDDIVEGTGSLSVQYRQMWQIDLATECEHLYNTAYDWLSGNYELCFTQTILKFDENTHRLWFVDNKGNLEKEFMSESHNLMAQAFFLLVWNHPEDGVKDYDVCVAPNDKEGLIREEELKVELIEYYKILRGLKPNETKQDEKHYSDKINYFCEFENRKIRDSARSLIRKAFLNHESERVHRKFAEKVVSYFAFDASEGRIKVSNHSTTIILPDYLMSDRLKKYNAEQVENTKDATD